MDRKNREDTGRINYNLYHYSGLEWLMYAGIGVCTAALVGWIFYRHTLIAILSAIFGLLYPKWRKKALIEKRRNILRLQFKDLLYYLGASLSAGKSVEQAFIHVYGTLKNLYPGDKADIVTEAGLVIRRLQMNENIEEILKDFAVRSGVEEIHHFSDVFSVCKRTGGNLIEVIRTTTRMISERIEIKQEIETNLSGKRQEQRILSLSPIALILFISLMSGEFMAPLFNTPEGRIIMTVSLMMTGAGALISERIMKIRF